MPAIGLALAIALTSGTPIGLQKGAAVAPFEPYHVSGPYKGTNQCPVCEWGMLPMVMVWTDLGQKDSDLQKVVQAVDAEIKASKSVVKGLLIDANLANKDEVSQKGLEALSGSWQVPNVFMLSRCSKLKDCVKNYKLTDKGWKTIVYTIKNRHVTEAFVNPTAESLEGIQQAIRSIE
ncbi:MAG: hypothetical protein JST40_08095 [Armatimonadetes bacterium]|nr:hypothetical protein [Armatimonadota bacterium]